MNPERFDPDRDRGTLLSLLGLGCAFAACVLHGAVQLEDFWLVLLAPPKELLWHWGAVDREDFVLWRAVTSGLLHGGLAHLFVNYRALLAVGPSVERRLGSLAVPSFLVLGNLASELTMSHLQPSGLSVGSSDGIASLVGALAVLRILEGAEPQGFVLAGLMAVEIALGLVLTLTGFAQIDYLGHAVGALFGATLCLALYGAHARSYRTRWTVLRLLAGLSAGLVCYGLAGLYRFHNPG